MFRSLLLLVVIGLAIAIAGSNSLAQSKLLGVEAKGGLLESMMLLELNKVRTAAGKAPFKLDDRASQLAREIVGQWAGGEIPNTSEAVRGERAVARATKLRSIFGAAISIEENFQPTGTPNSTVRTWMTHENERNRLLGNFHSVGIGIAADNTGEGYYGVIFIGPEGANMVVMNPPPPGPTTPPPPMNVPQPMPPPADPKTVAITFQNNTNGPIRFSWVANGQEGDAGTLEAGKSIQANLFPGQQYVARDAAGQELRRFQIGAVASTIQFGAALPQPGPMPQPMPMPQPIPQPGPAQFVEVAIENKTAGRVSFFWINAGVEEAAGNLPAGQSIKPNMAVGQQYVVRDAAGQELRRFTVAAGTAITIASANPPPNGNPIPQPQPNPPMMKSLVEGRWAGMTREQLEAEVVKEMNVYRAQAGVGPLKLDERVSQIARGYSDDVSTSEARLQQISSAPGPLGKDLEPQGHWNMHLRGKAVRDLFGGRSHFGENVMFTGTPESVAINWFNSPGHKVNMLHPVPTMVGVGIGVRASDGKLFYTAIFTKPQYPNGLVKTPLTDDEQRQLLADVNSRIAALRAASNRTSVFRSNATLNGVAQQWADEIVKRKLPAANAAGALTPGGLFDKSGYEWADCSETAGVDFTGEEVVAAWQKQIPGAGEWLSRNAGTVEYGLGVSRGPDGKLNWSFIMAVPR